LSRRLRYSTTDTLTPPQVSILAWLDKHGSMTLGELAAHEHVRPPSITPLVQCLEREGLITSTKDATDRRSTRASITALGLKELNEVRSKRTEFLERKLATLSVADRAKVSELATFLETLLEQE
jgi:DNA-binding MarR family transcriptional regulator